MIRHYVLTLTGSAQRLSAALPDAIVNGPHDLPCRAISLQPFGANAAASYLGAYDSGAAVSATLYGVRLEAGAAGVPPAPFILGEFDGLPMKLSEFAVIGANTEKLAVLVVS